MAAGSARREGARVDAGRWEWRAGRMVILLLVRLCWGPRRAGLRPDWTVRARCTPLVGRDVRSRGPWRPAGDGGRARAHPELGVDPVYMVLDGLLGQDQPFRDLAIRVAGRDERHDLRLARGQPGAIGGLGVAADVHEPLRLHWPHCFNSEKRVTEGQGKG